MKESGLRGRGGGGFLCHKMEPGCTGNRTAKICDCNADEGDPELSWIAVFLNQTPMSSSKEMAIAAYAVGANEGYVYIRAEYRWCKTFRAP
jgi:NADP-reducing hydrogenase subunit HndC